MTGASHLVFDRDAVLGAVDRAFDAIERPVPEPAGEPVGGGDGAGPDPDVVAGCLAQLVAAVTGCPGRRWQDLAPLVAGLLALAREVAGTVPVSCAPGLDLAGLPAPGRLADPAGRDALRELGRCVRPRELVDLGRRRFHAAVAAVESPDGSPAAAAPPAPGPTPLDPRQRAMMGALAWAAMMHAAMHAGPAPRRKGPGTPVGSLLPWALRRAPQPLPEHLVPPELRGPDDD